MNSPKVSIITSVYNNEDFIIDSVVSLISQSFEDFELILIDDGSTDSTYNLIRTIKDERIRLFKRDNFGLTKSLNFALSQAKGEWIARHDCDDMSMYNRLEIQMKFLKNNPDIDIIGSSLYKFHEKYRFINEIFFYPTLHEEILNALKIYNPFVHGSVIIRKEIFKKIGFYNEQYRYVQDYELWNRVLKKYKSHNIIDPLYIRNVHKKSSEININKNKIFDEIRKKYYPNCDFSSLLTDKFNQIDRLSIYPLFPKYKTYNKELSKHYSKMSLECKKRSLPWKRFKLLGFFYSPVHSFHF